MRTRIVGPFITISNLEQYLNLNFMWPAIIGAAAGIATSGANAVYNSTQSQKQRDWQEKMWHAQNNYNDPNNVANRMKQAGLNPHLLTDSQPAGSAGTGASASGMPFQNPLDSLLTIAQAQNLKAQTGKTETESERILAQIALDKQAFELGVITKQEYELRLKQANDAYEKFGYNPFVQSGEKTEIEIAESKSRIYLNKLNSDLAQSEIDYNKALTTLSNDRNNREAQESLSKLAVDSATIKAQIALANKTNNDDIRSANQDARNAAKHAMEIEIDKYLKDIHASEAEIAEIKRRISELWSDNNHDYTWNDIKVMALDFVHSNLRLGGSASYNKSTK